MLVRRRSLRKLLAVFERLGAFHTTSKLCAGVTIQYDFAQYRKDHILILPATTVDDFVLSEPSSPSIQQVIVTINSPNFTTCA